MRAIVGIFGLHALLGLSLAEPCKPRDVEPIWADIVPSSELKWVPCYEKADCARLEVPMDYDDPDGAKVTLAVIRHNATDRENYKGSVLFNSGGPNNSGVDWFSLWADVLHDTVGRNYDIVSWDPRSYSRSVPRISCWATQQRRNLWQATSPGPANQYDDMAYLETLRHRAKIENEACVDMMGDTGILEHVSTTHTARDLHALMTALGQKKLRYVGQSYGCHLATYFASMFPSQVDRIVCDGNIDPRRVLDGKFWSAPADTSFLLDFFAESCAANSSCALHRPTAKAVRERFDAIIENARFNLTTLPAGTQFDYVTQPPTFARAIGIASSVTADPYTSFAGMAKSLAAVEAGGVRTPEHLLASSEWTGASAYTDTKYRSPLDPDAGPKGFFNKYPPSEDWTVCNDIPPVEDDLEAFKEMLDKMKASGPVQAASFGRALACLGPKLRAKGKYTGPFGGNTSHPILFTNARYDPITYAEMAYANHKMFPGSGLLVYEAYGHSVGLDSPCVTKAIRTYFQDGTLPPTDLKCENEFNVEW